MIEQIVFKILINLYWYIEQEMKENLSEIWHFALIFLHANSV